MSAIEIKNLVKKFGKLTVVDNLSLSIPENKIFGLLGSNSAGKTTTINMLTGLLIQNSGKINVLGMESPKKIEKIRQKIALVPQTVSLYESLTIYENLEFFGGLYITNNKKLKEKIKEIGNILKLNEKMHQRISILSGGYQRRCSIGCALISDPKILFLDEPLTGIDIQTTELIINFLKTIKDITIILTTHSIKEAEAICDNVVFMNAGKKILEGCPKEIRRLYSRKYGEQIVIEFSKVADAKKAEKYLKSKKLKIKKINAKGKILTFTSLDIGNTVIEEINTIKKLKLKVVDINILKPNLEDIFAKVMSDEK